MPQSDLQKQFIDEEYQNLIRQRDQQTKRNQLTYKNVSIWSQANYKPTKITQLNKHNFNLYADKQLIHLVVSQKFNFQKISQILSYSFKDCIQFSEKMCQQRWYQLHRDRNQAPQIKEQEMQNKRIKSIMSMTDPFSLYNINEKLNKMQKQELNQQKQPKQLKQLNAKYHGYNIFKDSIRKIDDIDKYQSLQKQMRIALGKAKQDVQLEKPMLYTPYYQRLQQFEVLEEQLTLQKMQKMMSHPIQMELMERQLKVIDLNEGKFQSKIKKQAQKQIKQAKIRNQEEFQIQEDWDQYQSD